MFMKCPPGRPLWQGWGLGAASLDRSVADGQAPKQSELDFRFHRVGRKGVSLTINEPLTSFLNLGFVVSRKRGFFSIIEPLT